MKKLVVFFSLLAISCTSIAQVLVSGDTVKTRAFLDSLNRAIDEAVVRKEIKMLEKYYSEDFVFTHGTGQVDSRQSWLRWVNNPNTQYVSRKHDSTIVELHGDVAIIRGKLTVNLPSPNGRKGYDLWYIRVYARRTSGWQLLSHRTTSETNYF